MKKTREVRVFFVGEATVRCDRDFCPEHRRRFSSTDGTLTNPYLGISRCIEYALAYGALWGFGSREELVEAGAEAVCATPADLTALLTVPEGGR
jgi:hypothetical protein